MFLLDTNVISELRRPERADRNVAAWASTIPAASFFLSAISILEIELGALQIAPKDVAQIAVLRAWIDGQILPRFEGSSPACRYSRGPTFCAPSCSRSTRGTRCPDCRNPNRSRSDGCDPQRRRLRVHGRSTVKSLDGRASRLTLMTAGPSFGRRPLHKHKHLGERHGPHRRPRPTGFD